MIKICDRSLLKPLIVLFRNSIKPSCYPDIWKKSSIIPVHKKCQTIGWKLPTNFSFTYRIYNFLLEGDLLNTNQSGFRPSDSYINQLVAITHEIFGALDWNRSLEVRSVNFIKSCFISWSQWVSQEIFLIFLKIIYQVDFKELFKTDKHHRGDSFGRRPSRFQFWSTSFSSLYQQLTKWIKT